MSRGTDWARLQLNNLTLTVEQRISNTLLANNCNLLAMICQAPFVGDEAVAMSKGVLSLLGRQRGNLNERFLKRILRAKIAQHLRKGRDVSDIIRDNNMAAMLFGAFARHEGMGFLSRTLAPPIRQILDFLDQCEIDPAKVMDPPRLQAQTDNLTRLCSELLSSVVDARNTLPASLRRLCFFMKSLIDEVTAAQEAGVHSSVIERRVEQGEVVNVEIGGAWTSRSTSVEKDSGEETYTCSCQYDGNAGAISSFFAIGSESQGRYSHSTTQSAKTRSVRTSASAFSAGNDETTTSDILKRSDTGPCNAEPYTRSSTTGPSTPNVAGSEPQFLRNRGRSASSSLIAPTPRPISLRCRSGSNCQFPASANSATPPAGASPSPLAAAPISRQRTPVASNESLSSSKSSLNAEGNALFRLFARRKGKRDSIEPSVLHESKRSSMIVPGGLQYGDAQMVPLAKSEAYANSTVPTRRTSTGRGEGKYIPTSWPMAAKDAISENDNAGAGAGQDVTSSCSHRNSRHAPTCPQHYNGHARGSQRHSVLQPNFFSPPTADEPTDQPLAPIPDGKTPPHISVQPPSCSPAYLLNDVALGTSPDVTHSTSSLGKTPSGLDPSDVPMASGPRRSSLNPAALAFVGMRASVSSTTAVGLVGRTTGTLSVSEKLIGSFLFLRLLLPAVTAPDVFGIIDTKLTAQMRRGLVLSVKVLTALCNDIEFGAKEAYLTPMNAFLDEKRANMKEFLNFAAQDPDTQFEDGSNEELATTQTADETPFKPTHRHAFSTSNLRSGLSTSMPSLNQLAFDAPDDVHHNSASTVNLKPPTRQFPRSTSTTSRLGSSSQQIRRSRSEDLADVGALLSQLGRSMELIEKDLEGRIATLGARESEGVLANFFEMKRLVEGSQYTTKNGEKGETVGKSSGKLLAKLVKFNLGLKGLLKRKWPGIGSTLPIVVGHDTGAFQPRQQLPAVATVAIMKHIIDTASGLCWDAQTVASGAFVVLNTCYATLPSQAFTLSNANGGSGTVSLNGGALCVALDENEWILKLLPCASGANFKFTFNKSGQVTAGTGDCITPDSGNYNLLGAYWACTNGVTLTNLNNAPYTGLQPSVTTIQTSAGLCFDASEWTYGVQGVGAGKCTGVVGQQWYHVLGQFRNVESGLCLVAPQADGGADTTQPVQVFMDACHQEPPWTQMTWMMTQSGQIMNAESGNCIHTVTSNGQTILQLGTDFCNMHGRDVLGKPAVIQGWTKFKVTLDVPCNSAYPRKDFRDMSSSEKTALFSALNQMLVVPSLLGRRNRYHDLVGLHAAGLWWLHGFPAFLPWHKYFVTFFEQEVAKYSGNSNFALPYWDWTTDHSNWYLASTGILSSSAFGTTGRSGDYCVMDGFMNGKWIPTNGPCLKRSYSASYAAGDWSVALYSEDFMLSMIHVDPYTGSVYKNFDDFRNQIEGTAHDSFHNEVGGPYGPSHMNGPDTSVNDLVFFLHHNNIERFYRYWTDANPAVGKTYNGQMNVPPFSPTNVVNVSPSDTLIGFNVPVSVTLGATTGSFCRGYQPYSKSMANQKAEEAKYVRRSDHNETLSRRGNYGSKVNLEAHHVEQIKHSYAVTHAHAHHVPHEGKLSKPHRVRPAKLRSEFIKRMQMDEAHCRAIEKAADDHITRLWWAVDRALEKHYHTTYEAATHEEYSICVQIAIAEMKRAAGADHHGPGSKAHHGNNRGTLK
ncbi:hypothetical protein HK101_008952 [Irineochytrium annulatum]|nr:hypothetical protein HK101_008952 [Irineochytrium annulatum]